MAVLRGPAVEPERAKAELGPRADREERAGARRDRARPRQDGPAARDRADQERGGGGRGVELAVAGEAVDHRAGAVVQRDGTGAERGGRAIAVRRGEPAP